MYYHKICNAQWHAGVERIAGTGADEDDMTDPAYHTTEVIIERLRTFFKEDDNVLFAFLFGSHAEGAARRESDVDIAVFYRQPPQAMQKIVAINSLSQAAGLDVHLSVLNEAPALLRHQVLKGGVPIIIKERQMYYSFREKTMADYDEYKFVSGMAVYDR